jgi:5,10-methylene-tetrahydrofolate dehydrogenase/methenyl tetrahydrofolate cyclohydrolase
MRGRSLLARVCNTVLPNKDVDGFTQASLGRLVQGDLSGLVPCTALAVTRIVQQLGGESWRGRQAAVIGRSHNVGLPIQVTVAFLESNTLQILLGSDSAGGGLDMTTTLCHRHTPPADLARAVRAADLVVAAAGVPGIVTADMVRPGATVVDVGLSRVCHLGRDTVVGDVAKEVRQVRRSAGPGLVVTGRVRWLAW